MLTSDMLSVLCCPSCHEEGLRPEIKKQQGEQIEEGNLICDSCNVCYPVQSGIPDLMPHGVLTNAEWQMWRDHLVAFQQRREQRIKEPDRFVNKLGRKTEPKKAFSTFMNITEGRVLDLGCGNGELRDYLNNDKITYYGIDPMVVSGIENFPFARGLAEYLPFKDNAFSNLAITAALDHFKDLEMFFREAARVLQPEGRLHIMQSVHETRSVTGVVRELAHWAKDSIEDRMTASKDSKAPHHMSEFSKSSLSEGLNGFFSLISVKEYNDSWYTPTILFVSSRSKKGS